MHYTQYGNGRTFCGRRLSDLPRRVYTGLDSLVSCAACSDALRTYRVAFPQASSGVVARYTGDQITFEPEMLGGAR